MKKILLINGHPDESSFNSALLDAYRRGAIESGKSVKVLSIGGLDFNPNLKHGYQERMDLEPDLLDAWDKILWSDHIVWIYPMWWGFMPAVMKGFIDRLFLPGTAFVANRNSYRVTKKLSGKTSHIMMTMDTPIWYYKLFLREPGIKVMKKHILKFVGIKPVKTSCFGPIKNSGERDLNKFMERAFDLGKRNIK